MISVAVRIAAMPFLMVVAGGCAALNVQRPTMAFRSAEVKDVSGDGFTLNYQATVSNPNAAALPLSDLSYALLLGDKQVLDGKTDTTGTLPANGSRDLTIPVRVTWEHLLEAEQEIVNGKGDVPYNFKGSLALPGNPLVSSVPFSYKNTLSVKRLLRDAPSVWSNPAARKLSEQLLGSFFSK